MILLLIPTNPPWKAAKRASHFGTMKSAWSPSEKWFLVLSSLVTLGFGALGVGLSRDTRPDVVIPPHAPLPVPNGLDIYASAAFYSRAKPPVDPLTDWKFNTLSPSQKRARYSLARRNAWEKGASPAWAFFEQAKAAQSLAPRQNALGFGRLGILASDKVARANTLALRGDWGGALQNDLDDVQMGHDMLRGAGLSVFSFSESPDTVGVGSVEFAGTRIGAKGEVQYDDIVLHLSAGQAKAGARRLEELIGTMPRLSDMAREQKAVDETLWLQTWSQPTPGQGSFDALFHPKTQEFEQYCRAMDGFIAIADQPYDSSRALAMPPMPVASSFYGSYDPRSCLLDYAFNRAREERLMLRLALRAYRLEHGTPPAKLSDLTPAILKNVPIDPFNKGKQWRYKAGAAWSIGPDGVDNGGQPILSRPPSRIATYNPYGASQTATGDIVAKG